VKLDVVTPKVGLFTSKLGVEEADTPHLTMGCRQH